MEKDLENIINALETQIALNACHLKTLTKAFQELSEHLLPSEENNDLKKYYYRTLIHETTAQFEKLDTPHSARALFDLKEYAQSQLVELEH